MKEVEVAKASIEVLNMLAKTQEVTLYTQYKWMKHNIHRAIISEAHSKRYTQKLLLEMVMMFECLAITQQLSQLR